MRTAAADNLAVYREVREQGLDVRHMRYERHLEAPRQTADDQEDHEDDRDAFTPDWWEAIDQISRPVGPATGRTPFRSFLDGVQRTLPSFFTDVVPISSSINAAAILTRDDAGDCAIAPGSLRFQHTWLIPGRTPRASVAAIIAAVQRQNPPARIEDPLDDLDDDEYAAAISDYNRVALLTKARASKLRQRLEDGLLSEWPNLPSADGGWLVVDGTLRRPVPRAVGLAKSFVQPYLTGDDYQALFRLSPGHRTRAFQIQPRGFPIIAWYLRLWDATGRDPRYSLVRLETFDLDRGDPDVTARIDDLSAWILAERIPSAKADERWATLLYPVHHLERMLKRRLDMEIAPWWS